ncbi:MAG: hypothetical protein D6754_08200 [Alphaproteobacteria bacterium]|nr:MAG: hypothetical protein D6754_08200 [Alphaproteobacteria bacterium]
MLGPLRQAAEAMHDITRSPNAPAQSGTGVAALMRARHGRMPAHVAARFPSARDMWKMAHIAISAEPVQLADIAGTDAPTRTGDP